MPKEAAEPLGRPAFYAHFALLSRSVQVGEDSAKAREAARAISRARQWAEAWDYLAALHALGGLELVVARPADGSRALTAGEVEEALGDLRRALEGVGEVEGTAEAAALWQAAREEVIRGSWEAAAALMEEAHARLGRRPGGERPAPTSPARRPPP